LAISTAFDAARKVNDRPTNRPMPSCSSGVVDTRFQTYTDIPKKIGLMSARNKREVASTRK